MFRAGEMPVNRAPCVIALWTLRSNSKPQFPSVTSGMGDAGCTLDKRAKKKSTLKLVLERNFP